jgi:hypothetical protein
MAKNDDDLYIEFQRDFAYRGVHLGKGFILNGSEDRAWAEYISLDGNLAKRVPKPDYEVTRPWEDVAKQLAEEAKAAKPAAAPHPTAPHSFNAPQAKSK